MGKRSMSIYSKIRKILGSTDTDGGTAEVRVPGRSERGLRQDAETILQAAVGSVDPEQRVAEVLAGPLVKLPQRCRIHLAGFGVAAAAMARGACRALGCRIASGILVVPAGTEDTAPRGFECFGGGHPLPDQGSVAGSLAIRQLAREMGKDDLLLCLVSGGGSSLLTIPPEGLPLEEIQQVTRLLLQAGATSAETACVERHLDLLKGGGLAREITPGAWRALVLADGVGEPLDVVAGGPLTSGRSRVSAAVAVLKKIGVWESLPLAARGYLDRGRCGELEEPETDSDSSADGVSATVVGDAGRVARSACRKAEELGYEAQVLTSVLGGTPRESGRFLAASARALLRSRGPDRPPLCLVTAGEIRTPGRYGGSGQPNQELALAAALAIEPVEPVLIASMSTTGADGPAEAAGAIATGETTRKARAEGMDCEAAVLQHGAHAVFERLDDRIVSGPTGTAVGDVQLVLLP